MAALAPEQAANMRRGTRDAAVAFLEDLHYFHDILKRDEVSASEIRRASVALRRLLTDRELHSIASPRVGRVLIKMPNPRPAHLPTPSIYLHGGLGFGGLQMAAAGLFNGKALTQAEVSSEYDSWNPSERTAVRIDNFLSSPVLHYVGSWITRAQVILYIANVASGAHTGTPKEPHERVLRLMRRIVKINHPATGKAFVEIRMDNVMNDASLYYSKNEIDAVLFELMAMMHFLLESPDIVRLESTIRAELKIAA